MLISLLLQLLISNALASNINKAIVYSRYIIISLISVLYITYNNIYIISLECISLYNGLFNVSLLTQTFDIFVISLTAVISVLTSFYARKIMSVTPKNNEYNKQSLVPEGHEAAGFSNTNMLKLENWVLNKNGFQFTIIEYSLITLFILSGVIFLISVGDLVSLFLSIELQSYGLYILATIYRNSESATGSGLTYFLLGGLSSCFILLGSSVLYVNSGMTNLDNIYILNNIDDLINHSNTTNNYLTSHFTEGLTSFDSISLNYINFSLIILTVGLLFKISAAPFHFWSPDVYDGIPTIVTTFVAIIAKISLLILMIELVTNFDNSHSIESGASSLSAIYSFDFSENNNMYSYHSRWSLKNILILSSLMSLFIGSLLGLTQYRIKRLFAYSTISHVGFILLALSINKIESIQAYIFYILQYSICNLNAFFILIAIGYTLYQYKYNYIEPIHISQKNSKETNMVTPKPVNSHEPNRFIDIENSPIQLLSQIKGYFHINSFLALSFSITLFSFVGIPPLIGFFAKQMVLSAALDEGYIFMVLVAVITSVIGAAYYLNLVKLIFFSKSDYSLLNTKSMNNSIYLVFINDKLSVIISILTMFILFFIFMPDEWFRIVNILSLSINKF